MNKKENNSHDVSKQADKLLKSYKVNTRLQKEEAFSKLLEKIDHKKQQPHHRISWYIATVASAAAAAAILIGFWLFTATHTIHSEKGDTFAFRLPDNSRIVLHDGSSISYKKFFWNRNVTLNGEAYFEVEKGAGFQVKTRQGEVEVLGTRFSVNEMQDQLTVQCYEGKVKTTYNDDSWLLEKGTRFSGKGESAATETVPNGNGYPGFAKFSENFQHAPVSEVLAQIELFFEVDIQLKEDINRNFSGNINTGSLENALQIVCEPLQLKYVFDDKYRVLIY